MAEFRYLFADLLTNRVNLEVPCYGVSYNGLLNKASDGTCSINLDRSGYNNQDVIDATVPGKTAMYIDRDGVLIWGGIVWSRTYQAQAKVFSYTLQTFESYAYKVAIEETLAYADEDQRNILCELFVHMQQKLQTDIGIQVDPGYPFTPSITRTVTFDVNDAWTYGKAIDYMIEYDQGFDYYIDVFYAEDGSIGRRIRTDNVLGAAVENTGLVFDYPGGNVSNYWWPENASRGAVSVIGYGSGDITKLTSKVTQTDLLDAGFPNIQEIYSNSDVSVQATLDSQTAQQGRLLRIPITVPTVELNPNTVPVGTWQMGDYAKLEIEDARFPAGLNTTVRVIGYEAQPPSSDEPETIKPIIEGADTVG